MAGEDRNRKSNKTSSTSNKSSKSNDSSENFSGLVGNYSRALDRSADSLKSAARDFKDSAKEIADNNDRNTDKIIKALSSFAKSFDKQVDDIDDLLSGNSKEQKSEFEKNLEKYVGENKRNLTKTQAVLSATIKTFAVVANAVNRNFQRGFNSILNNYNENYSSITARMNKSNKDYTDMLMDKTKKIRQESLTNQFSQIDFTRALQDVLVQGIRDIDGKNTASEMAYNNMITKQVLPMISTNTRTYVRYSKLLGETFSKGITTIGTEIQKTYGAEGLEQNQADTFLETISADIFSSAIESGKSQKEAVEMLQDAMSAYGDLSSKYGSQVAEYALGQLKDYLDNPGSSNAVTIEAASRAGIEYGGSVSGQQFTAFLNNLIGDYQDYTSGIGKGIGGEALGISPDILRLVQAAQSWGDKSPIESLKVNTNQAYDELKSELSDGFTRSITAQADKWNENLMSGLADAAGQYIPHADEVLSDIWRIVKIWFGAWTVKGVFGGGEGGSILNSFGGGTGGLGGVLKNAGEAKSLYSEGATFAEVAEAGGTGSAVLGKAATMIPGGLVAGGLIWGGVDAWKAGSQASQSGENVAGSALQGFFTGSSTAGMSYEQKKAYYEQNGYFSWGDMFKNAGKGALVGGGLGMMSGTPLGPVAGGLIGGAVGAVTNAIDQWVEADDFKTFSEAMEGATNSVKALSEANSKYDSTLKNTESALDSIKKLKDPSTATASELESLKSLYPEYTKSIKDINDLNPKYIEALEKKIEREQYLNELNAYGDDWNKNLVGENLAEKAGITTYGKGVAEFVSDAEGPGVNNALEYANKHYKEYGYGSRDEYYKALEDAGVAKKIYDRHLEDPTHGYYTTTERYLSDSSGISKFKSEQEQAENTYSANLKVLSGLYDKLEDSYTTYTNSNLKQEVRSAAEKNIKTYISGFTSSSKNLKDLVNTLGGEYPERLKGDSELMFTDLEKIYEVAGAVDSMPKFRTGANKIQRDSLVGVHKGEAILNPAVAAKARELSEGGISGFINSLYGFMTTQVTAVGQSSQDVFSPVVESINHQTDILSDLLSLILQDTTTLSRKLSGGPANRSQIDERLRSFSR